MSKEIFSSEKKQMQVKIISIGLLHKEVANEAIYIILDVTLYY